MTNQEKRDKVAEILKGIYEAGEYHKRARSNDKYRQQDIDEATAQILALDEPCKMMSGEEIAKNIVNNFADLMLPLEERLRELENMIASALAGHSAKLTKDYDPTLTCQPDYPKGWKEYINKPTKPTTEPRGMNLDPNKDSEPRCNYEIAGICSKAATKDEGIVKCDLKSCKYQCKHEWEYTSPPHRDQRCIICGIKRIEPIKKAKIEELAKLPCKELMCECKNKNVILISHCRNCGKEIEDPPTIKEMLEENENTELRG